VFVAVFAGLRAVAPEQVPRREAWVLTQAQTAGHTIAAGDLRKVQFPVNEASEGSAEPGGPGAWLGEDAVGRVLAVPWPAGLPLHAGAVAGTELLSSLSTGEVAVPLSWEDASAARLVSAGDLVDVVVSTPREGRSPASTVLVSDARVLWCEGPASAESGWLGTERSSGATVVLAVPRQRAAELSSAPQRGAVSLVLTG
jgi:Flp pilus assembly protein CpaB